MNNLLLTIERLFALAAAKKRELNYKFLWTKNGIVFLRKDENSRFIKCVDTNVLDSVE